MRSLCLLVVVLGARAWADQCDFIARAGGLVSMRSGKCSGTTGSEDKKSGREKCVDDQGKPVSELSFEVGKRESAGFYTDYNDQRLEGSFRAGVADGPMRVFDRDGKLRCELTFKKGKAEGPVRELYPSGKLKEAWLFADGKEAGPSLSLFENGKVKDLACAPSSFVPEDKALCGYGGKAVEVELYNSPTERRRFTPTWKDGVLTQTVNDSRGGKETRTYSGKDSFTAEKRDEKGTVRERFTEKDGQLDGAFTLFTEGGQTRAEARFEKGKAVSARQYFLNGRLEWEIEPAADGHLRRKEYDDLGNPRSEATWLDGKLRIDRDGLRWPLSRADGQHREWRADKTLRSTELWRDGERDGVAQELFKSGKVAVERRYEKGVLLRMECLSPRGARELLEEYYPDGSRKSDPKEQRPKDACDSER